MNNLGNLWPTLFSNPGQPGPTRDSNARACPVIGLCYAHNMSTNTVIPPDVNSRLLAKALGVSDSFIRKIRQGYRKPQPEFLAQIIAAVHDPTLNLRGRRPPAGTGSDSVPARAVRWLDRQGLTQVTLADGRILSVSQPVTP